MNYFSNFKLILLSIRNSVSYRDKTLHPINIIVPQNFLLAFNGYYQNVCTINREEDRSRGLAQAPVKGAYAAPLLRDENAGKFDQNKPVSMDTE